MTFLAGAATCLKKLDSLGLIDTAVLILLVFWLFVELGAIIGTVTFFGLTCSPYIDL